MNETAASDKKSNADRMILGMGIAYLLFLAWAILWKCGAPFIGDGTLRTINLLPFHNNTGWELEFNLVLFVPFGFYLAAWGSKLKLVKLLVATVLVSLVLEVLQFALAIGVSDITDLLMNTLGGIIGIAAFYAVARLLGKHERTASLVLCVLLTLLELYMTLSFIVFGQLDLGYMVIRL